MNIERHQLRRMSDLRLQSHLSRLLAERRAAERAREARFRRLPTPSMRKPAPKLTPKPEPFGWVDSGVFLLPLAVACVLILLARWAGWLA